MHSCTVTHYLSLLLLVTVLYNTIWGMFPQSFFIYVILLDKQYSKKREYHNIFIMIYNLFFGRDNYIVCTFLWSSEFCFTI